MSPYVFVCNQWLRKNKSILFYSILKVASTESVGGDERRALAWTLDFPLYISFLYGGGPQEETLERHLFNPWYSCAV